MNEQMKYDIVRNLKIITLNGFIHASNYNGLSKTL